MYIIYICNRFIPITILVMEKKPRYWLLKRIEFGRIFIKLAGRLMLLSRLLLSVFILFAQAAVEKPL